MKSSKNKKTIKNNKNNDNANANANANANDNVKKSIFNTMHEYVQVLNNNKFFTGILILVLNLGSKFITIKFSPSQEVYLKNKIGRQLLIFAIAFIGTKDIYISIFLTAAFVILADYLFNEDSKYCILPESFKELKKELDANNDGVITPDEIEKAIKTLQKHKKHHIENVQKKAYKKFKDTST